MAMSDPIADMLTRIRNGLRAGQEHVFIPASRMKEDICRVLQTEGYIDDFTVAGDPPHKTIRVALRYTENGEPVISKLERVSKPSLRVYVKSRDIQQVRSGLGISIVSTSQGLMTGKQAYRKRVGGEVLCEVW